MLILTRRISEILHIGDDVLVTILAVKGNQVRIGIDAPKTTAVHRAEIYKRIQAEKNRSSTTSMPSESEKLLSMVEPFIEKEDI